MCGYIGRTLMTESKNVLMLRKITGLDPALVSIF